ncbi:MAG: DUF3276 family protein [Porphyromonadaceae bacterium]|nr:DUF3276 family protein [Porphyromonadaceae bacterium]
MEENVQKYDNGFVFSKAVKSGKRIYYFDIKKVKNTDNLYITITESKKNTNDDCQSTQTAFYKQRLLIFKEDFKRFTEALKECIDLINKISKDE